MSSTRALDWRSDILLAAGLATMIVSTPSRAVERLDLGSLGSAEHHDQFIVKYREESRARTGPAALQASLDAVAEAVGARVLVTLSHARRIATGAEVVRTGRQLDRMEAEALMRQFAADPAVEYIEVDTIQAPHMTPNDPHYYRQWSYHHAVGGIRANNAWDYASGQGVVVAVLDSGITRHDDLDANVLPGYDFVTELERSNDGDGRDADPSDPGNWVVAHQCRNNRPAQDQDSDWHGTHVAGTIAAVTNNHTAVAGVAHGAKIVPVRVLGTCGGRMSDTTDAIIWASGGDVPGVPANPHPAEVINLSLGSTMTCGATYQTAIDGAVRRGTTVVVSAGNENMDAGQAAPGNCASVITVAATTQTGERDPDSNYGLAIDIAAPGASILSTDNPGRKEPLPNRTSMATMSGTSMAAPHVSGVVALIQSHAARPYTPAQVESILKATARPFPNASPRPIGPGIVDAMAAVHGAPPAALNLKVVGTPKAGYTLTAQYTYDDPEGDKEGGTTFQWYRHKPGEYLESIPDASGKTYAVQGSDIGSHRLLVVVKPRSLTGTIREGREVQAQTQADVGPGSRPIISGLTVSGQPIAGYTLRALYDFADADGDTEGGTRYQWYRHRPGDYLTPIDGAIFRSYTVKPGDIGSHRLLVKVTPRSITGFPDSGTTVEAQTDGNVVPGAAPVAVNPRLSGTPLAGYAVTAKYDFNDADGDKEGATSYQWYLHQPGNYLSPISGATSRSYTVKPTDVGPHRLLVVITPRSSGGYPDVGAQVQAQSTENVIQGSAPAISNPRVVGSPVVGHTVSAEYAYADPDGDTEGKTSFQWYLHQPGNYINAISDATGRTYTVKPDDIGNHRLLVMITPRATTGYPNVGAVAQAQTPGNVVPGGKPLAVNASIIGTPKAGQTVTAYYNYADADGDLEGATSFQWYLHQPGNYINKIPGATGKSYAVKPADVGPHFLLVEITPRSRTGYPDTGAVTQAQTTSNVFAGTAPVATNLSISGVVKAGQTVKAQYNYFDADGDPEGPTTFQWYLHQPGNYLHRIPDGVAQSYKVKASDAGNHRLLVVVTPRSATGLPNVVGREAQVQSANNVSL